MKKKIILFIVSVAIVLGGLFAFDVFAAVKGFDFAKATEDTLTHGKGQKDHLGSTLIKVERSEKAE